VAAGLEAAPLQNSTPIGLFPQPVKPTIQESWLFSGEALAAPNRMRHLAFRRMRRRILLRLRSPARHRFM